MTPESSSFEHHFSLYREELTSLYIALQNLEEKAVTEIICWEDIGKLFPDMNQPSERTVLLKFGELLADTRQDCHILILELLVRYGHAQIGICGWLEDLKKGHLVGHEHQSLYVVDQRKNLISGIRALRAYLAVCIEVMIPTSAEILHSDIARN